MEKDEILEGNKLIAEFMDIPAWKSYWNKEDTSDWFDTQKLEDVGIKGVNIGSGSTKYLYFDSSWDWLMPVVEKIETLKKPVHIHSNGCTIYEYVRFSIDAGHWFTEKYGNSKLEATWLAVVEFINWYNKKR